MASPVGPQYPASGSDDSSAGTVAWSNPDRVPSPNGSGATVTLGSQQRSHYLLCQNYNPAIPTGATIDGITVEVRGKATGLIGTPVQAVYLVDNTGAITATFRNDSMPFGGSFTYDTFGGSSDAWGSPTAAALNGTLSGFAYYCIVGKNEAATVEIDTIRATYYYTPAAAGYLNLLLMGCGSILSATSAWLGYLPWLRSKLWHAGYWLKGGRWTTRRQGFRVDHASGQPA